MADKVEWINKLKSIATLKTGQGTGEHGLSIRQSHSDGSLVSVSLFLGFVLVITKDRFGIILNDMLTINSC